MTNEELRARLWEAEKELAETRYFLRERYFKHFKTLVKTFTDDEGRVQWDFLEQALIPDGRVTLIPYPLRSWLKSPNREGEDERTD